jgi:hypothetical protein
MRHAATLVLVLALSACDDFTTPFDFSATSATDEEVESAQASSPGPAVVRVDGIFEAPNACHQVAGALESGNTLTVTVRSTAVNDPACGTEPVFLSYRGTASGLPSGTYGVVVIHAPQGVEARTVLQDDIFVE